MSVRALLDIREDVVRTLLPSSYAMAFGDQSQIDLRENKARRLGVERIHLINEQSVASGARSGACHCIVCQHDGFRDLTHAKLQDRNLPRCLRYKGPRMRCAGVLLEARDQLIRFAKKGLVKANQGRCPARTVCAGFVNIEKCIAKALVERNESFMGAVTNPDLHIDRIEDARERVVSDDCVLLTRSCYLLLRNEPSRARREHGHQRADHISGKPDPVLSLADLRSTKEGLDPKRDCKHEREKKEKCANQQSAGQLIVSHTAIFACRAAAVKRHKDTR